MAREMAYALTATVSNTGHVLSTSDTRRLSEEELSALTPLEGLPWSLTRSVVNSFRRPTYTESDDNSNLCWPSYLMRTLNPSIIRNPGETRHLPNSTHIVSAFEQVFRRAFAMRVRLNRDGILAAGNDTQVTGNMVIREERIRVNPTMALLSGVILLYMLFVAVSLYVMQRLRVFGHIPTTLAGTYTMLYASNAKDDCGTGCTPAEREEGFTGRYSYGSFRDTDGGEHFGIYRESEVGVEGNVESVSSKHSWWKVFSRGHQYLKAVQDSS